jgi:alkylation response protein AidB-like acyl-CoA dehydrogenase
MVLAQTSPPDSADRHGGFSQFIVATDAAGVTVRPIRSLVGPDHFTEVVFDDVALSDEALVGTDGQGWRQVTSELAFERSGPERFLSTYPLLALVVEAAKRRGERAEVSLVGALLARLWALRQLSLRVAHTIARGGDAELAAALVKELGTRFEGEVIEVARRVLDIEPDESSVDSGPRLLAQAIRSAPAFTLRGGTSEILRGVVARGVGLR